MLISSSLCGAYKNWEVLECKTTAAVRRTCPTDDTDNHNGVTLLVKRRNPIECRLLDESSLCLVGSVAEWLACWTQAQKGLGSNRSRDAVG